MNYNDIWNDICYRIKNKNQNAPEREFQIIAEFIFDKLGWLMRKGEIVTGKAIPAGSADSKKPDIIIADNGKYLFVVELKKPAAALTEQNARNCNKITLPSNTKSDIISSWIIKLLLH